MFKFSGLTSIFTLPPTKAEGGGPGGERWHVEGLTSCYFANVTTATANPLKVNSSPESWLPAGG